LAASIGLDTCVRVCVCVRVRVCCVVLWLRCGVVCECLRECVRAYVRECMGAHVC